jgi:hypothetical protein
MGQNDDLSNKKRKKDDDSSSAKDEQVPGREGKEVEGGDNEETSLNSHHDDSERESHDDDDDDEEDEDEDEYWDSDLYDLPDTCVRIAKNDPTLVNAGADKGCDQGLDNTDIYLLGKALVGNTHLQTLRLGSTESCFDTEGGVPVLCRGIAQSQLHQLDVYELGVRVQKSLFRQQLAKLSTLRDLVIWQTKLDARTLTSPNQFLTCLTLDHCELNHSEMMALSQWIFGHSSLLSLKMSDNGISDSGVNCICEHWNKADSPLKDLELGKNRIGPNGAQLLMREAARHSVFCKLDLSRNPTIGQRGLELIGQELSAIFFHTLIIDGCCDALPTPTADSDAEAIQDAVCQALADGLRGNSSLVRLDIGCNHLGAKGAQMLMQAVAVHPSLQSLSLTGDKTVGFSGLKWIGMELPHTKLKSICLANCDWSESPAATSAGQALLDGVRRNRTLTSFYLPYLPRIWNDPIQFFMQVNRTCRPLLHSDVVVPAVWPYILERFQRDAKLGQVYWSLREQPWLVTTVP